MAKTNHVKAYEFLRDKILVDPRNQGSFINELSIAEKLGVSRTPVREALRVLSSEGLVEFIPNRGTLIPVITDKQILDLMELRRLLECYAADAAIAHGRHPELQMKATLKKQEDLLNQSDHQYIDFVALDREFHFRLLQASGNSEIVNAADRIQVRQRIAGTEALFGRQRWGDVCTEHEAIVVALKNRDSDAATRAISDHLNKTQELIIQHRVNQV